MFEWKIILTVIVTLGVIMAYLGTNPVLSGFFGSISEKLSFIDNTQRNVEFTLQTDKYSDMGFSVKSANFTIAGSTNAALNTGNLVTDKVLDIYGFQGTGSISDRNLSLSGKMSKVGLPDITVAVQETVKLDSKFTSLKAVNIGTRELKITNTSGVLTVKGTTTQFSGDIDIVAPAGDFGFFADNVTFTISGKASKITLSNGLSIG